jgi:hypothetical protein
LTGDYVRRLQIKQPQPRADRIAAGAIQLIRLAEHIEIMLRMLPRRHVSLRLVEFGIRKQTDQVVQPVAP